MNLSIHWSKPVLHQEFVISFQFHLIIKPIGYGLGHWKVLAISEKNSLRKNILNLSTISLDPPLVPYCSRSWLRIWNELCVQPQNVMFPSKKIHIKKIKKNKKCVHISNIMDHSIPGYTLLYMKFYFSMRLHCVMLETITSRKRITSTPVLLTWSALADFLAFWSPFGLLFGHKSSFWNFYYIIIFWYLLDILSLHT